MMGIAKNFGSTISSPSNNSQMKLENIFQYAVITPSKIDSILTGKLKNLPICKYLTCMLGKDKNWGLTILSPSNNSQIKFKIFFNMLK